MNGIDYALSIIMFVAMSFIGICMIGVILTALNTKDDTFVNLLKKDLDLKVQARSDRSNFTLSLTGALLSLALSSVGYLYSAGVLIVSVAVLRLLGVIYRRIITIRFS